MLEYKCIHKVGDMMGETKTYDTSSFQDGVINSTIKEVAVILEERGYDPINQIVGYLVSGDPGYISSHKEARNKILKFERTRIMEALVREFIE